ncbi:MAG TPA: MFS transporter [Phycisphaerales bacterium]|nr:MFS transporter [Phycisphaerales bacterium]
MTQPRTPSTKPLSWWRDADSTAHRALIAAGAGWMLDAMDISLYTCAILEIGKEFDLSLMGSGAVAAAPLLASALGGTCAGFLADRFGRTRMLTFSILAFSIFTACTATSQNVWQLVVWRVLVGLGMGAEWSCGAVLLAETWPAQHRGKAIGLMQSGWAIGYILAVLLTRWIVPYWGWRALFVVGVVPALLVFWIRRSLPEPGVWKRTARAPLRDTLATLSRAPYLRRAVVATATASALLFAYWGLFSWVPGFLAKPIEEGGAGLSIVKSWRWIVPMQIGAFFGYAAFGFLADRLGRRPTFIAFVVIAAVLVPIYGHSARDQTTLMLLGPLVGFFGHGYFSVFGSMLAELFPTSIRGGAQGLCYDAGRAFSALAPITIGAIADRRGLGVALGFTSILFILGACLIILLPETRAKEIA